MRRRSIIPFVAVLPLGSFAYAQNWIKPAGGSWGAPNNWSGDALPTDPNFDLGSTSGYVVTLGQNFSVNSFTVQTDTVTINLFSHELQSSSLNISTGAGQVGALTLVGGGEFYVSNSATDGTGEVSGGQLTLVDTELVEGGTTASGAGFNVNGLLLRLDGLISLQQTGNFFVTNGTFNEGLMNSIASGTNLTVNQIMATNGSYITSDTLTVGNATVDNSTLTGNTAMSVTGTVTVQDSGTLTSPTSTVSGTVSVLPASYFQTNQLTMTSTGTFSLELDGKTGDPISQPWTGDNGTLDVTFQPGFVPTSGEGFGIFGNTSLHPTGTFATLNLPAVPSGDMWYTNDLYTTGDLYVVPIGVPEPMSLGVICMGVVGLAMRRRTPR